MHDKGSEKIDAKHFKPVYGVAFHSPLDIEYIKPVGCTATTSPTVKADLLYSETHVPNHESSVQLVFQSLAELIQSDIRVVLDVSNKGQIVPIKGDQIDKILSIKTKSIKPQIKPNTKALQIFSKIKKGEKLPPKFTKKAMVTPVKSLKSKVSSAVKVAAKKSKTKKAKT